MPKKLIEQLLIEDNEEDVETEQSFKGDLVLPNETPSTKNWYFPPLYSYDQNNKLRIWQIGFEEPNLIWIHGIVNGALQTDKSLVIINESKRNIQEQALLEAKKKVLDKSRDGYKQDVKVPTELHVQLANKYHPPGTVHPTNGKKENCQLKTNDFPVWLQVKMDGVRGSIRNRTLRIDILSREGLAYPWMEHIREEATKLFEFLPAGAAIDTELLIPGVPFEITTSAVKTSKTKHELNHKLRAHIFDLMIEDLVLEERYAALLSAYQQYLTKYGKESWDKAFYVVTHTAAYSHEDIEQIHNEAVERGYEGVVIRYPCWKNDPNQMESINRHQVPDKRKGLSLYRGGKNNNLLKFKGYEDAEGTIIDVKEGEGRETGLAVFRIREDGTGIEFNCRPRGIREQRAEWFTNKEQCIGKRYTYRFIGRTSYGVPLFNTGVAFRDYE